MNLNVLELSPRIGRTLKKKKITSIEELKNCSKEQLKEWRLDLSAIREIQRKLSIVETNDNSSIEEMMLSADSTERLKLSGIETVGELRQMSIEELMVLDRLTLNMLEELIIPIRIIHNMRNAEK